MTRRMMALELEHGRPIRSIIIDAYTQLGSLTAAAVYLGMSERALYYWMERLGIHIAKTVVEREPVSAGSGGGS